VGESISSPVHTSSQAVPASYTMSTRTVLGLNRLALDDNHPPPSGTEIKKVWSYTSASIVCLDGRLKGLIIHLLILFINFLHLIYIYSYIFIYIFIKFAFYLYLLFIYLYQICGPGSSVGKATKLRAGLSGIESQWRRDFKSVQIGPGAHPASCKIGTGYFLGVKCSQGVLLTTHPF
jgi:hypothetical protein